MGERKRKDTRVQLTKTLIDGLEPRARMYMVADAEVVGLSVRVMPSGVKTYLVRGRDENGQRIAVSIGSAIALTVKQARDKAKEKLSAVVQGQNPNKVKREARNRPDSVTFGSFLDTTYREHLENENHRARENTLARLKSANTFKEWLGKPLDWITRERVEEWQESRKREAFKAEQGSLKRKDKGHLIVRYEDAKTEDRERFKAVGNRTVMCLRAALTVAVDKGLLSTNPLNKYKLRLITPETRTFTPEQQRRLFEAVDARERRMRDDLAEWNRKRHENGRDLLPPLGHFVDYVKPLLIVLFATGMRRGEALKLQWKDVDLENGTLTVTMENAKTKRARTIPLTLSARETLAIWRRQTNGLFPNQPVFTSSRHGGALADIKKVWQKLLKDAELPRLGLHSIRHTVATEAIKRTDIATTQRILGHSQITTTARYLHPDNERILQGLEAMEDRRANVIAFGKAEEAAR